MLKKKGKRVSSYFNIYIFKVSLYPMPSCHLGSRAGVLSRLACCRIPHSTSIVGNFSVLTSWTVCQCCNVHAEPPSCLPGALWKLYIRSSRVG